MDAHRCERGTRPPGATAARCFHASPNAPLPFWRIFPRFASIIRQEIAAAIKGSVSGFRFSAVRIRFIELRDVAAVPRCRPIRAGMRLRLPGEQSWAATLRRIGLERFWALFAAIEKSYFDAKVDSNGLGGGGQKSRFLRVSAGARCQIRVRTPQKQPRQQHHGEKGKNGKGGEQRKSAGKL